jgi:hypothetical protein
MSSKWECLTIDEALALLRDPQFSVGCVNFFLARDLKAHDGSHVIPREQVKEFLGVFVDYWGVLPPMTRHAGVLEQEDARSRRRPAAAILDGQWGLVPIFPWTTDSELAAVVRRIRRQIGKEHVNRDDARDGLADWLDLNGFPHALIAEAVYGRRQTARERRQQKLKRMRLEQRALRALMKSGMLYRTAHRRATKGVGSVESKAAAMVRVRVARFRARSDHQARGPGNDVAQATTALLRAGYVPRIVRPLPGPLNGVLVAVPSQLIDALDNFRQSLLK